MTSAQITANRYQDLKNTDSVSKQDVDNAVGDYAAPRRPRWLRRSPSEIA